MLEVTFYRDARKRVSSIVARGHAQAAPHGTDVVCAAASAILQAAILGLESHAKVEIDYAMRTGDLHLALPNAARESSTARAILATAELGIAQIARQYPKHVRIRRRSGKTG